MKYIIRTEKQILQEFELNDDTSEEEIIAFETKFKDRMLLKVEFNIAPGTIMINSIDLEGMVDESIESITLVIDEANEIGFAATNIDLITGCCTICGKNLRNERVMFPRNCTPENNCLNDSVPAKG